MYKADCYFILTGAGFSPIKLEQLLKIEADEKSEPGQVRQSGRYKNMPAKRGFAVLRIDRKRAGDVTELDILKSSLVKKFIEKREMIRILGVESIVFHIDIAYKDQCNIEISNLLLKKLNDLDMPVTLTCYESEHAGEE